MQKNSRINTLLKVMHDEPISQKINLLGMDLHQLKAYFTQLGEKPFRGMQVFKWLYQHGVQSFDEMTDIGKDLRVYLSHAAEIKAPSISHETISRDGTIKWLFQVDTKNYVETVLIPDGHRGTLCVSSQAGCALNCTFCSTATQGFSRNLQANEIIGQLWCARKRIEVLRAEYPDLPNITNVVMMGMGEPLLNLEALLPALSIMTDDNGFCLSRKRVTVSTSGVVPGIYQLCEAVDVALALSLHAPNDDLRAQIVPLNKKYNIAMLMQACKDYVLKHKRDKVTMEYVMLKGINDQDRHAKELIKLLKNIPCKVNLIPFNPFKGTLYESSPMEQIYAFRNILVQGGLVATIRVTRGQDIDAACGQLVGNIKDRTRRSTRFHQALQQRQQSQS